MGHEGNGRRGRDGLTVGSGFGSVFDEVAHVRARFAVDPSTPARLADAWTAPTGTTEEDEAEFVDAMADCLSVGLPLEAALASWRSGTVDVERPVQVIDLVLQDARVPAGRADRDGLAAVIERLDGHGARARHERLEPLDAEAALVVLDDLVAQREARRRDDVEGDGFALLRLALADVLDDGELQGHADLRRRQPHARRVAHRLAHELDELLELGRREVGRREGPRRRAQHGIAGLDDLQEHARIVARSPAAAA